MTTPTFPSKISEYISSHFRDEFLFQYKNMRKIGNKRCFAIDVSKDDHIYHLFFDENGRLVKKQVEESFVPDHHTDPRMGDTPE